MLDKTQEDLNNTNLEIYRIKQELCESEMEKDKLQKKINGMKNQIETQENNSDECSNCERTTEKINELVKEVEESIFELTQKGTIISGLCKEIQNLQI